MPYKSALCRLRKKISYQFFKDIFERLISDFEPHRKTYLGMRVYAIDGMQLHLPRTKDVIDAEYSGRAVSKYRESYQPRMYVSHAYDVLSGVTKAVREGSFLDELHWAHEMVPTFEEKSLTLYDRLYISKKLIQTHKESNNYFLMRARKSSFKEVRNFYGQDKKRKFINIDGVDLFMVKVFNPNTNEHDVFVSNLPSHFCFRELIKDLYGLRWEVETSFKELSESMQVQQWHSKFINGIRQEFYTTFWLMNFARIKENMCDPNRKVPLSGVYEKPNFKLLIDYVVRHIDEFLLKKREVIAGFKRLLILSTEKRERRSRVYARELKSPASPYPRNNTLWSITESENIRIEGG